MRLSVFQFLCICAVCFVLAACGSAGPTITQPVGRVQLGMTITEVTHVLGDGQVVEAPQSDGAHKMEVREYPAGNGRVYSVRFIDGLVRRWELQNR